MEVMETSFTFPHNDHCELVQYPRGNSRFMQQSIRRFQDFWETWNIRSIGNDGVSFYFFGRNSNQCTATGKFLCMKTSENPNNCLKAKNCPNYVWVRVWSLSKWDNSSIFLKQKKDNRCNLCAVNTRCLAMKRITRVRGWIRKDTRIGRVLNKKFVITTASKFKFHLCLRIIRLFGSIVNDVDKYVTESMPTAKEEDISSGKSIATARPKQNLVLEKKMNDTDTQRSHDLCVTMCRKFSSNYYDMKKKVLRGSDGAINYTDIQKVKEAEVRRCFATIVYRLDMNSGKRGRTKKRFQCSVNPNSSNQFLGLWAIQKPKDSVTVVLHCKTMYHHPKNYWVHRREREWVEFHNEKIPGGKSP